MVGDALEDCLKAVSRGNYDATAATRSKKPNAHGYFSQCAYWAMVRRIQKQEKEEKGKANLINSLVIEQFIAPGDTESRKAVQATLNKLRNSYSEQAQKKEKNKTGKHYGWSAPKSRGNRRKKEVIEQIIEE